MESQLENSTILETNLEIIATLSIKCTWITSMNDRKETLENHEKQDWSTEAGVGAFHDSKVVIFLSL